MRKRFAMLIVLLLACLIVFGLSACQGKEFTVTFDGNGGTLISGEEKVIVKEGSSVTPPVYERTGYSLSWGDISFDAISENVTVKAVWTPIVYNINYVLDGGTNHTENPLTYTIESEFITIEDPIKEGHSFNGFAEGNTIPEKSTGDKTFTASWIIYQYTYTFYDEDNTILKRVTANHGSVIEPPSDPTKEGTTQYSYIFDGWDKEIPKTLTGNIIFTAKYVNILNRYTYTFYDEDGVTVLKTRTEDYGTEIVPPNNPLKDPTAEFTYLFLQWEGFYPSALTGNVSFNAVYYSTKNQYTYRFYNDNGVLMKMENKEYGSEIVPPYITPTKAPTEEYTFVFSGWDKEIPEILTDNIMFTAVYENILNKYTVSFDSKDGSIVPNFVGDYGKKVTKPANPTKEDTFFLGWYIGYTEYDFDSRILVADITLYARWAELEFAPMTDQSGYDVVGIGDFDGQENIVIPSMYNGLLVKGIWQYAFYDNEDIKNLIIKEGIEYIGTAAYAYCTSLETVSLPASLTSISGYAFASTAISSIIIPDEITDINNFTFSGCASLTSITLPSKLNRIGTSAFASTGLTSFNMTKQVTTIGANAFSYCSSLVSVDLKAEEIFNNAFVYCTALENVTLSDALITIGNYAFSMCSKLASITLPSRLTTIGEYAFSSSGLVSITIPSGVRIILKSAFSHNSSLTSVNFEEGVETIGDFAFYGSQLTSVVVPDSVKVLGMQAFSHSDNLILAVIGAGIESMGANVFSSALRKVTMKAAVPPESGDTFFGVAINTVYVPAASVELYKTADKFSYYEKFITAMPSVTFNSQGGSEIPSIIDIPYGMTIKEPASPTYEFYTFEGWYLEAECQNRFEFQTAVITENITLYANWLSF